MKFMYDQQVNIVNILFLILLDVLRTIQSAETNLLGFYPPAFRQQGQVIDINILESASETM